MAQERKCLCCGATYKYCPSCNKDSNKPAWMFNYDKESCKDLFNAISGYNMGIQTKDNVKTVLDKYNITDYGVYKESISKVLNDLFPPYTAPFIKKSKGKKMDIELKEEIVSEVEPKEVESFDEGISE